MLLLNRLAERGHAWRLFQHLKKVPLGSAQAFELLADAMPALITKVMHANDVQTLPSVCWSNVSREPASNSVRATFWRPLRCFYWLHFPPFP